MIVRISSQKQLHSPTIRSLRRGRGTLKASWTLSLFSFRIGSPPLAHEKSLFFRQGDYWIVGYRRTVAFLKTTRGLQDLALLLRNPGREFHVCECRLFWGSSVSPLPRSVAAGRRPPASHTFFAIYYGIGWPKF